MDLKAVEISVPTLTDRDCWNEVGVNGDASCPELSQHVHCRNCPVYSAAAARVLDRWLPEDYRREWTEHFRREKVRRAQARNSAVVFRLGQEWLALPTSVFQEIAESRPIHSLPHRRDGALLGVVNIRGALQICVSLVRVLDLPPTGGPAAPPRVYDRLLVTEWEARALVFPVEEVFGIHRYRAEELEPPPATLAGDSRKFSQGIVRWQGRVLDCLDERLLFPAINRSFL